MKDPSSTSDCPRPQLTAYYPYDGGLNGILIAIIKQTVPPQFRQWDSKTNTLYVVSRFDEIIMERYNKIIEFLR